VCQIGLLLLQDSDCGTVSQQNYDKLTSPSDSSAGRFNDAFFAADCCGTL